MRHDARATDTVAAQPENFLTAVQVASRLKVSRSTVYNLVGSGRLAAHRHGSGQIRPRGLRIPESAISNYLRDTSTVPETAAQAA